MAEYFLERTIFSYREIFLGAQEPAKTKDSINRIDGKNILGLFFPLDFFP